MPQSIDIRLIQPEGQLYQQERLLRNKVLLRPIGIPDFGWEHLDQQAWHFVALKEGRVIGCVVLARLNEHIDTQLMQMAVEDDFQGQGIGSRLVKALLEFAKANGVSKIEVHARSDVSAFYEGLGFEVYGDEFEEVGVKHKHMSLQVENCD